MDEVDRKLLSMLHDNGRATLKQLGDTVNYSPTGVKKRMERLIDQNVMKVSALLNLETLNIQSALLLLELESGSAIQKFQERFKGCPRIVNMFSTLGGFNLAILMIAEDTNALEGISSGHCPLRAHEGVRRSEFYPISGQLSPYLPLKEHLVRTNSEITPCQWNCKTCQRYIDEKCLGCSATSLYRGP